MNPTRQARRELARREIARREADRDRYEQRRSFRRFVEAGWHALEPNGRPFIENRGTDALIRHLQAVGDGEIRRLLIAISPGFGKSTFASIAFPLWMWTRHPAWRVICASHAYSLATTISGKAMRVLESDWYRGFGVELTSQRVDKLENTASGSRMSVGVAGALTGFRADAAIVDDSLNAVDAYSANAIETVNNWFDMALTTRLDRGDTAPIVVIQQCLAENDLLGYLRKRGGWDELVLPAEAEAGRRCRTSIGWEDDRAPGELLAPQIHSRAFLDEQRVVLGPYGYAAQYQQRPAPLEGGMIKRDWWKRFTIAEITINGKLDLDWITISVDPTGNAENDGDNVGLLVVGGKGPRRYVLEDATRKMTFLETCAAVRALLVMWPTCRKVLVEKSVVGPAIVEQLRKEVNQGALRTVVIEELTTHMLGKKEQRAMAMVPAIAAGLVYLLDGASWITAFVGEHAMFPNGQHDDRVDALAQLLAFYAPIIDVKARWKVLSG